MRRLIFSFLVPSLCGIVFSQSVEPVHLGSRLELFVDEYLIDRLSGAELRLHSPVRREVVMVTDKPWEGNASHYRTVFRDGDRFRMYYAGQNYVLNLPRMVEHPAFLC